MSGALAWVCGIAVLAAALCLPYVVPRPEAC